MTSTKCECGADMAPGFSICLNAACKKTMRKSWNPLDPDTWSPADMLLAAILDLAVINNVTMEGVQTSADVFSRFYAMRPHLLLLKLPREHGERSIGMALTEEHADLDASLANFLLAHGAISWS